MPAPISVQLYTLRKEIEKEKNHVPILKFLADTGYIGIELGGIYNTKPKDFLKLVTDLGLKISGAHVELPDGDKTNATLDEQEALGNKTLISGFGPDVFKTAPEMRKSIARFSKAAENAKKRGMRLGMHNHWWEFSTRHEGKTAHEIFMAEVDSSVFAELDIYWTKTGGVDPVGVVRQLGKRAPILHVKDGPAVTGQPMTAVGKGTVPIEATLKASTDTEWHVVELDDCATDMYQAVRESYQFLTSQGLSKGRK